MTTDIWFRDYSEEASRQYKEELKRQETYLKNRNTKQADHDVRMARWLAMGIPDHVAELQVSYERHIDVRRMRDIAGMTLAAIGTRLSLSTERVRQIYLSKKHEKTPPAVKWLREGEACDLELLASMVRDCERMTRGKK